MRADQLLVERGLAASRSQAQRLIGAGVRALGREGWRSVSNSTDLAPHVELELQDVAEARFVSRGGLKLDAALAQCGIDVAGLHCLDVGQSTGGFTDCLLQRGAASVLGVDVGHGQLHPKLRADPRVAALEGLNMRDKNAIKIIAANCLNTLANPEKTFKLVVGDLSFISQTLIAPNVAKLLAQDGDLLMLVKPQFELQPADISKGGLVKSDPLLDAVLERVSQAWQELGLAVLRQFPSAIRGGDGNREFFVHARFPGA